jgi:hypothetical protein
MIITKYVCDNCYTEYENQPEEVECANCGDCGCEECATLHLCNGCNQYYCDRCYDEAIEKCIMCKDDVEE